MSDLITVIACVVFVSIIVLHVLTCLFRGKTSSVLGMVNVCLHISLVPMLLFLGAELELITLVIVSSLFIYLLAAYIAKLAKDKKRRAEDCDV